MERDTSNINGSRREDIHPIRANCRQIQCERPDEVCLSVNSLAVSLKFKDIIGDGSKVSVVLPVKRKGDLQNLFEFAHEAPMPDPLLTK
jgi:hypothetical protein